MIITRRDLIRLIRSEINGSLNEQLAAGSVFRDIWSMGSQRMRDRPETLDLYRSPVRSSDRTAEYELRDPDGDGGYTWHVRRRVEDPDGDGPETASWGEWEEATEQEKRALNRDEPRHVKSVAIATATEALSAAEEAYIKNAEPIPEAELDRIAEIIRPHGENTIVSEIESQKGQEYTAQNDVLFSRRGTLYDLERVRADLVA